MSGKGIGWLLPCLLGIVILLPYGGLFLGKKWHDREIRKIANSSFVIVDKGEMCLRVLDYKGRELLACPVTTGKNYGNKTGIGDFRTPEGIFYIEQIQEASSWEHDFGDGLGPVSGSYGPWFIRLHTPGHKGIGIHGTHKPEMLGKRDSEGCIRVENDVINRLKDLVGPGTVIIVLPGEGDVLAGLLAEDRLDSLTALVRKTSFQMTNRRKHADSVDINPIIMGKTHAGKRKQ